MWALYFLALVVVALAALVAGAFIGHRLTCHAAWAFHNVKRRQAGFKGPKAEPDYSGATVVAWLDTLQLKELYRALTGRL